MKAYVKRTLTSKGYFEIDLIMKGTDELALINPLLGSILKNPTELTLICI